jgi:hypothetical protein
VPIILVVSSFSIGVLHFPWSGPILMTAWFGYVFGFWWSTGRLAQDLKTDSGRGKGDGLRACRR